MIFVGMCFGAPLLSFIAQRRACYLESIVGAGVLMSIIFTLLVTHCMSLSWMMPAFLIVGVCSSYQILSIYQASTYLSERVSGLTTAVANMVIMSFGYMLHSLIGLLIHITGGPSVKNSFVYGISVIPLMLLVGVLGYSLLMFVDHRGKSCRFVR